MKKIPYREQLMIWVMCALTFTTVSICAGIEILNIRADNYLPRELPQTGAKWRHWLSDETTWRMFHRTTPPSPADPRKIIGETWPIPKADKNFFMDLLRRQNNPFSEEECERLQVLLEANDQPIAWEKDEDRRLFQRLVWSIPLSAEEQQKMEDYTARARAYNQLHAAVESIGLLQYLLAPITWIFAAVMLLRPRPWRFSVLAMGCLTGASVSIALMFYRGYFTSLGW